MNRLIVLCIVFLQFPITARAVDVRTFNTDAKIFWVNPKMKSSDVSPKELRSVAIEGCFQHKPIPGKLNVFAMPVYEIFEDALKGSGLQADQLILLRAVRKFEVDYPTCAGIHFSFITKDDGARRRK